MNHSSETLITDFSNLAHQRWEIVNDSVMGGRSSGHFQILSNGNALFSGTLSLENNGGFTSVKNRNPLNLEGYKSIILKIKGDGKRYSFRFRTGENGTLHDRVYESRFETRKDEWLEIRLPLNQFVPVYRGKQLSDAPPPDLSSIREYGFLISDEQKGEFRLEIASIVAVVTDRGSG